MPYKVEEISTFQGVASFKNGLYLALILIPYTKDPCKWKSIKEIIKNENKKISSLFQVLQKTNEPSNVKLTFP
jgi:hypothetical protein